MRNYLLLMISLIWLMGQGIAQTVIIDYETPSTSAQFTIFNNPEFDGQQTPIIANPDKSGINTSDNVGVFVRDSIAGVFAGGFAPGNSNFISFENGEMVCIQVWAPEPGNMLFKLENGLGGASNWERPYTITAGETNQWIEICFDPNDSSANGDPPAIGNTYTQPVIFFDYDETGTASGNDETYYFDNIVTRATCNTILDFEDTATTRPFIYFGNGTIVDNTPLDIIANPDQSGINMSDSVMVFVRDTNTTTFAGAAAQVLPASTFDFTNGGEVCIDIWTPTAGTFKLKLEGGPNNETWERDYEVSAGELNQWIQVCFDSDSLNAPGGPSATGKVYTKPVVFFDFNTTMNASGKKDTSFFDNICLKKRSATIDSVTITINLGLNGADPGAEGVFIAGGGNFGNPGRMDPNSIELIDGDNDGIYSATFRKPKGFTSYFTFTAGCADFGCKEQIAGQPCSDPNNFDDRQMVNVSADTIINACFGQCTNNMLCPMSGGNDTVCNIILNFEDTATSRPFTYFGNGTIGDNTPLDIIANPDQSGINMSDSVMVFVRDTNTTTFAGAAAQILPATTFDFTSGGEVCIEIWTPTAGIFKFKLEGGPNNDTWERDYTVAAGELNQWIQVCFNSSDPDLGGGNSGPAAGKVFTKPVLFFDFNTTMNASGKQDTSFFDNICVKAGNVVIADSVTITVNLGLNGADPGAAGVFIAGGGNFGEPGRMDPNSIELTDGDNDGIYSATFRKPKGFTSYFTFTAGCNDFGCKEQIAGQPCSDPNNFDDRQMVNVSADTVINACFGQCTDNMLCPVEVGACTTVLDFEDSATTRPFFYFGNGTLPEDTPLNVIFNPDQSGINMSDSVLVFVRDTNTTTFAGAATQQALPTTEFDFTNGGEACVQVWTPTAGKFLLKLEGGPNGDTWERDYDISESELNQWIEICLSSNLPDLGGGNFGPATGKTFNKPVIFFDFGTTMNASGKQDISYVDNICFKSAVVSNDPFTPEVENWLKVMPSRTNRFATLTFGNVIATKQIMLINTSGQVVKTAVSQANEYQLDTQDLPAGLYFVRVFAGGLLATQKLIRY